MLETVGQNLLGRKDGRRHMEHHWVQAAFSPRPSDRSITIAHAVH